MKKSTLLDIIVFLYAFLFLYATVSKILDYELFKAQIGKSPLIMNHAQWIAWVVPALEVLLSLALFIPRTQMFALFGSFTLMTMFTLYIAFILTFSPYVPCSCGGILNNLGWTAHLIFNIAFMALAVSGIMLKNKIARTEEEQVSYSI